MSMETAFGRLVKACDATTASMRAFTEAYAPPRGSDDAVVLMNSVWPDTRQRFTRLARRIKDESSAGPVRPGEEPTP